jgi:hypothetical protein
MTDTRTGSQAAIYRGDKATATNFTLICGIDVVNQTITRAMNERTGRACTAFAKPYVRRGIGAKDHSISGTGLISIEDAAGLDLDNLLDTQDDDDAYYWKIEYEDGPAWTGKFWLNSIELGADASTAEDPEMTISISLSLADGSTLARVAA